MQPFLPLVRVPEADAPDHVALPQPEVPMQLLRGQRLQGREIQTLDPLHAPFDLLGDKLAQRSVSNLGNPNRALYDASCGMFLRVFMGQSPRIVADRDSIRPLHRTYHRSADRLRNLCTFISSNHPILRSTEHPPLERMAGSRRLGAVLSAVMHDPRHLLHPLPDSEEDDPSIVKIRGMHAVWGLPSSPVRRPAAKSAASAARRPEVPRRSQRLRYSYTPTTSTASRFSALFAQPVGS